MTLSHLPFHASLWRPLAVPPMTGLKSPLGMISSTKGPVTKRTLPSTRGPLCLVARRVRSTWATRLRGGLPL